MSWNDDYLEAIKRDDPVSKVIVKYFDVVKLIKEHPNDQELGKAVRAYYLQENKEE